jgi:glycosyltransferase involved in cell wall biosynthesis
MQGQTQSGEPRPRVAYFSNQFADREGHGLARYSRELFHALRDLDGPTVVPVSGWSSMPPAALEKLKRESGLRLTGLGRRGTSLLWTFLDRPSIESQVNIPVDVVHAVALGYPVATRRPLVVTIHDLGPLTHPEFFRNTRPWVMQRSLDQAVRKAEVIVCVSHSTADEVRSHVGSAVDGRLRVVHEGVSEAFFRPPLSETLSRFSLPKDVPYILSAGALSPRKNLVGLLKALVHVVDDIPHNLLLVGGSGWDAEEFHSVLGDARIRGRVRRLGFVSDDELRALYAGAAVYVHPSLYEGFGLTVLEAMASGAPVIASNLSSLPEVSGSAARLSDTTDHQSLAKDILEVCTSEETQSRMREAGLRRARAFSWDACARSMAEIYAAVSRGAGGRRPG